MNAMRWPLLLLTGVLVAGLGADTQPAGTPRPPKKWVREAAAFNALPAESQRRIRQLDRELREEDSESRARYLLLLQRYNDWVEKLSAEDRRSIDEQPTTEAKIKRIREIKEQQWISTLPKAQRDQILDPKITPEEKQKRIAKAKEDQRQADLDWQLTLARMDERQEFLRFELNRLRKIVLDKLPPEERKAKEAAWQNLRRPGVIGAMLEEARRLKVPLPKVFENARLPAENLPLVDNVRLREFMMSSEEIRTEFEARLRDPEKRELALQELIARYWEQHPEELRIIRARDKQIQERKRAKP